MGFYESVKNFWEDRTTKESFLWAPRTEQKAQYILKYIRKGDVVLDLGCGDGEISKEVSKIASHVVAVDYVEAIKKKPNNVSFEMCDIKKYEPKEKFDVILMLGVSPYLQDQELKIIYSRMNKSLKCGGYFLLEHQSSLNKEDKTIDCFSEDLKNHYNAIYRSKEKDVLLLSKSGFSVSTDLFQKPKWLDTAFFSFVCRLSPRINFSGHFALQSFEDLHNRVLSKPIDQKGCQKLLERFSEVVSPIPFIPAFGTLLGIVRENRFIPHDTDIDVIILENHVDGLIEKIRSSDITIQRVIRMRDGDILVSCALEGIDAYLDACVYLKEEHIYQYPFEGMGGRYSLPFDFLENEEIDFLGKKYQVPIKRKQLLERWFGPDWEIPKITPDLRIPIRTKFMENPKNKS